MQNLIKGLIENGEFAGLRVMCPECSCIEDEQYYCITCEDVVSHNGEIQVEALIKALIIKLGGGYVW